MFTHLGGLKNNLTPIRSFPDGARLIYLESRIPRNVHADIFIVLINSLHVYKQEHTH